MIKTELRLTQGASRGLKDGYQSIRDPSPRIYRLPARLAGAFVDADHSYRFGKVCRICGLCRFWAILGFLSTFTNSITGFSTVILVTGAAGQLGTALRGVLGPDYEGLSSSQLDITDRAMVERVVTAGRPIAIINCAAYTAVDLAEDESEKCRNVNAESVRHLADAANQIGSVLVQVSTDYVFGGATAESGPNSEDAPTLAQGVYAATKLEGEEYAKTSHQHLIIRTCGIYGHLPKPKNFVESMLRLGADRDELRVVNDQRCNPTSAKTIAIAIKELMDKESRGVFHVAASPALTWCEFAREIFRQAGMATTVAPITTREFGAKAARPGYSVMDTSKYTRATGMLLPSITDDLAEYLANRQ